MEPNIQLSNLALHHLLEELQFLKNGFVNNVQTLENNWLKIKIHTKEFGGKNLIISPNAVFVSGAPLQAKQSPGGFSAFLKKHINNSRILSVSQHGLDRIVVLEFSETFLIIELFAKGNIILTNKDHMILRAMRREEWSDRKLMQNELYKFPSSKGLNVLADSEKDFSSRIFESTKTFFGAAVDALNVSPAVLEFVFEQNGLDKKKDAKKASETEVKKVFGRVKEIYLKNPVKPFTSQGIIYTAEIGKPKEKEFEDVNSAINSLFLSSSETSVSLALRAEKKKGKALKELDAKRTAISGLEVSEKENKEKGEAIYLNYQAIKELSEAINAGRKKGFSDKEIIQKINSAGTGVKIKSISKNLFKAQLPKN